MSSHPVPAGADGLLVSVVVPTLNERGNVEAVIEAVAQALAGLEWEIVFVDDDSRDGTAEAAKAVARGDRRVRCLRRIGRRGLASAGLEGFLASPAPYVALMDGDLQHDPGLLRPMIEILEGGRADLVVASRYVEGGSAEGLSSAGRARLSAAGGRLFQALFGSELTDPMSGFFMLRRDRLEGLAPRLSATGFKLLADIVASSPDRLRIAELPMRMRARHAGESKLDTGVKLDFLLLLLDKTVGRVVPTRFVLFCLVGALGLCVHLVALTLGLGAGLRFDLAQGVAAVTAMTTNFILNNAVTYRDRRLKGARLALGLLSFYAVCSVGVAANVGVAGALFERDHAWWASGVLGALVGAVWNYAASRALTWRTPR